MWHQPARFEKRWPSFCQIWIIFTHLRSWIASARHNLKWVKIQIKGWKHRHMFAQTWKPKGFFQFKIILIALVSYFRFIWIPMLWIYGHYKYFYSYSARIDVSLYTSDSVNWSQSPRCKGKTKAAFLHPNVSSRDNLIFFRNLIMFTTCLHVKKYGGNNK